MPARYNPTFDEISARFDSASVQPAPFYRRGAGFEPESFSVGYIDLPGGLRKTSFIVDITGLASTAAGDIIGTAASTAPAYFHRYSTAVSGTPVAGLVTCLEAPATGEPDIDVFSAVEGTGALDGAISSLTETALVESAADWIVGTQKAMTGLPTDGSYLYLVASGGGDAATYTAGKFLIEVLSK